MQQAKGWKSRHAQRRRLSAGTEEVVDASENYNDDDELFGLQDPFHKQLNGLEQWRSVTISKAQPAMW